MSRERSYERDSLVDDLERAAFSTDATAAEERGRMWQEEQAGQRRLIRTRARAAVLLAVKERWARWVVGSCGILFALEATVSVWLLFDDQSGVAVAAVNSAAKALVFSALCALVAYDLRRFRRLLTVVIVGEVLVILGLTATLALGMRMVPERMPLGDVATRAALVWLLGSVVVVAAVSWARSVAARRDDALGFLSVFEFRTLRAIAELAVDTVILEPDEVARNLDDYLASFRSRRKFAARGAVAAVALRPLLGFRPVLHRLDPSERLMRLERWQSTKGRSRLARGLAWTVGVALDLTYLGFYGDGRCYPLLGYVPRNAQHGETPGLKPEQRIPAVPPARLTAREIDAEVVVVGTGAAASVIAYELARRGRHVLMVERGRHLEPDEIGADELLRRATLLENGGLGQILDRSLPLVAGSGVGGNTNLGSGPLIAPPGSVLEEWESIGALRDRGRLEQAVEQVTELLAAAAVPPETPAASRIEQGIAELGIPATRLFPVEDSNRLNQSTLLTLLRKAQEEHGEQLAVLSECEAKDITWNGTRATGLDCQLRDGRRLRIRAEAVVLAAGAPRSSLILVASGVERLVGDRMSFYVGCRMTARFSERMDASAHEAWAIDGHVLRRDLPSPADQALHLPLPVERHRAVMLRFPHLLAASVLVGTRAGSGRLRRRGSMGLTLDSNAAGADLQRLRKGLHLVGELLFAAGAECVIGPYAAQEELRDAKQLESLVTGEGPLALSSAYPLGGNALSGNADQGVIDPHFRVHGRENVFVCDASVLPTSLPVDPQLTVMALAHMAAESIAGPYVNPTVLPPRGPQLLA
jgi:hypothetical protein